MHIIIETIVVIFLSFYYLFESIIKFIWPTKRKNVRGQTVLITGAGEKLGCAYYYPVRPAGRGPRLDFIILIAVKKNLEQGVRCYPGVANSSSRGSHFSGKLGKSGNVREF